MKFLKHLFMLSLFGMISLGASATVYSGSCGGNANWSLDTFTGRLSITGSGKMLDYLYSSDVPWYKYIDKIKSLSIGDQITSIGSCAFFKCSGLTSVTIPNSVTLIGFHAFRDCSNLTSVTIPNSVTSIGFEAFAYCSGLSSVTIPNSVTSIGDNAFRDCSGLKSIVVESSNTVYDSRDNCNALIETASNTLIRGCMNTTIPNSVISIGISAFSRCSGLTSVTIPNSVTMIGDAAFSDCSGLTSVTIPNSVTEIGAGAFDGCSGLTSVTIPNSVTSIGYGTFSHCSGLTSVTIPNSVKEIGGHAFHNCSGLTSVTIPNSVISIGNYAFLGCSGLTSVYVGWINSNKIPSISSNDFPTSTCDLYVPTGKKALYQKKEYWKTFKTIYEYGPEPDPVLLGDANEDGSVDVSDITTIATIILNGKAVTWNEESTDVNGDGVIDVSDITGVVSIILGKKLLCPDDHHPHAIDLGLPSGTKWCCCNVGATTPEGFGGYYAWGETSEKSIYNWDTYAYGNSNSWQYIGSDIAGTQYDVAAVLMGGSWRMPSHEQQSELMKNCTRTWTQQNGVNGILVTGKNGGQVFLPATVDLRDVILDRVGSYGYYWSSSAGPYSGRDAQYLKFHSGGWDMNDWYNYRYFGFSVRAVCP